MFIFVWIIFLYFQTAVWNFLDRSNQLHINIFECHPVQQCHHVSEIDCFSLFTEKQKHYKMLTL